MLIFFISILYSTKTYHDANQTLITSFEFGNSKKALYHENIINNNTPSHFLGKENKQINIKKIETCKYIIIDSITINVDELIIGGADQFPFKIINGGKISIRNTFYISSNLNEKIYIPQEINDTNTIVISNGDYVVNSLSANSKSYILHNAKLSFEGNSFFANTISGDSESTIDLQKTSSLTVEVVEGNLTIICSDNRKTNLYISKPSSLSHLIVYNETNFFAINCTIDNITVFPSNENSDIIQLNLYDSHLNIGQANLSNCLILSENSRLKSTDFNLKESLFSDYELLIENPDITINDIFYQGNATFKGKFILSLTGSVKQTTIENPLIILQDGTSNLIVSDEIFILINSPNIEANKIQFNYSNLILLQSQEQNLILNNLNSFSFIDFSTESKEYQIQINNEDQIATQKDPIFYISMIGNQKSVNLKIDKNTASKIDFLTNLTESNQLSISVNSILKSAIEINIIEANSIEISELNNVFEFIYFVSNSIGSVTFKSIGFNIIEDNNDTFYLSYTLPLNVLNVPTIESIQNFETILIHDVNQFPTFSGNIDHSIELDNCHDIQLSQDMTKQIKTSNNSDIHINSDAEFIDTLFRNCNLTSSNTITFKGTDQISKEASVINMLECTGFTVNNYRPLFIDNIIESQNDCKINCIQTQLHINSNDNHFICTLDNDDSYIYIDEKNISNYNIKGEGKFILKNANEIDDEILTLPDFSGSLFIYNTKNINITNDGIKNLKNLLILSSEFTIDNSISIENIEFFNSTAFISDPDIELKQLVLYNSNVKSVDNIDTKDEKYATLRIKKLLFNGEIIVTNLNLCIEQSVNSMINFYKEYKINQTVFSDSYNQETHSKVTMIPSNDTKITFGVENDGINQFYFGDNHEHSLFSFHGNSVMTNEDFNFLNFEYFFSNVNFTDNDSNMIGNIKSSEYPIISFDTNKTKITCPSNQKVIIVNEKEKKGENYSVFEVACSSNDNFEFDELASSKNCTSDEYNTLICLTENEDEIEASSSKVTISNSFFISTDDFKCNFDSIIFVINNINHARLSLNVTNNSEIVFYDKQEGTLNYLNMENNSKISIYRNIIDNTSLIMSNNCNLTILDTYDEYYHHNQLITSNTTGYLHEVLLSESSINCDFMFNISTSSFLSSSCSFTNAKIIIQKTTNNNNNQQLLELNERALFENTLLLKNSIINISQNIEKVQFNNFQYNGNNKSCIVINGNANFSGIVHVNGVINCPNKESILDLVEADSSKHIILYDLQIICTVKFANSEVSDKLHFGGSNSLILEGTTFIPSNLSVFVEGRIHFHNFNLIDSISYLPSYVDIINDSFVDTYHGRPEIVFHNYKEHQVDFSINGQANVTVLDDNITFTKSFETYNDSVISFVKMIIFKEGATFNGHHIIEGSSSSLSSSKLSQLSIDFDHVLWTGQFFVFNDFSCKGKSKVTIQSDNITIKDLHEESDSALLGSIQANLMKIEQLFNLSSFFTEEIENENKNETENENEKIDKTVFDWENINIVSTNHFRIHLFSHSIIYFHNNEIKFNNTNVELHGGYIKDVLNLDATNSTFDVKDDYIESEKCEFKNTIFTNFMSSIGCHQLTTKDTQFNGYVDLYLPTDIDMTNATVNLSLPNNYPLFNIHNVIIYDDENELRNNKNLLDVSTKSENEIFDLQIKAELNVIENNEGYETAKLFMFDVMPNSLPIITTTQTKGERTEYLFNSEIINNRIITFKSLKCGNNGEYNSTTMNCIQCINGSYSYEDKCYESPEGMFINTNMKLNRNCPFGYYNDKQGQSDCTKCPDHMTTLKEGSTSKSDCVCEVNYMFDDSFSTNDNEKCIKCPEGLSCNTPNIQITNVKILEDYFYYNKEYDINNDANEFDIKDEDLTRHLNSTYIFKCLTSNVCLNPVQSNQRLTQCKKEYNGFLCAKCVKNYFHKSINLCRKCSKFPIVALVFGPIIHAFLIWLCFIHDDRYSPFFYYFMLFTQQYINIYGINIDWPAIFTYVSIIFESINLDFRRFFDCETNDEVWNQGYILMIINCFYTATFIVFFIFDIKSYKKKKIYIKDDLSSDQPNSSPSHSSSSSSSGCCKKKKNKKENDSDSSDSIDCSCCLCHCCANNNNNNDNDNNNDRNTDKEKVQTRVVQILTIYYFMTFLTQLRWLLSVMASNDGHLIVYPYIILKSKDYAAHSIIILVNSIYFFGFLLFFVVIFCYIMCCRPVTVMLSMFKYTLYEVKYCFIFLPFIYVIKSLLMVFFVVYKNHNWYVNIYLIVVLILCLEILLYSKPFINDYIRQLEVINTIFEIFIVTMGIMAQQTHSSFEIFSIVLLAIVSVIFIVIYVVLILKYRAGFDEAEKLKEDYNNRDATETTEKKEVLIKYRNECNQFFFYDEKFNLNIIIEWFFKLNFAAKIYIFHILTKMKKIPEIKDDLKAIKVEIDENFDEYNELFRSFYESRDSNSKEEIHKLLNIINSIDMSKNGFKRLHEHANNAWNASKEQRKQYRMLKQSQINLDREESYLTDDKNNKNDNESNDEIPETTEI